MPAHRQSALLLHGLNPADRRWLLAQLPLADRQLLQHHLAELKSLGIPADSHAAAAPAGLEKSPARSNPGQTPHNASAAQIGALLADEPVWLIGHLLALDAWPWRAAYLADLPSAQRQRLVALAAPALAPQASASLLAHLQARLAGSDRNTPGAVPSRAARRSALRQVLKRWL